MALPVCAISLEIGNTRYVEEMTRLEEMRRLEVRAKNLEELSTSSRTTMLDEQIKENNKLLVSSRKKSLDEQIEEEIKKLSASSQTELLDEQKQKIIIDKFFKEINTDSISRYLYYELPVSKQFSLLKSLAHGVSPSAEDWRNLFKPVTYDFSKS